MKCALHLNRAPPRHAICAVRKKACHHSVRERGQSSYPNSFVLHGPSSNCLPPTGSSERSPDLPSSFQGAVIHKLCVTGVSLLLFLTLTKTFPVTSLADDWFVHKANFLTRLGYLYVVMQASKPKYYLAWTLGKFAGVALNEGGGKMTLLVWLCQNNIADDLTKKSPIRNGKQWSQRHFLLPKGKLSSLPPS